MAIVYQDIDAVIAFFQNVRDVYGPGTIVRFDRRGLVSVRGEQAGSVYSLTSDIETSPDAMRADAAGSLRKRE